MQGREAAEAGFDLAVGRGERDAEVGVEGTLALQVVVGFVDGVEQVEGDDDDVDAAAVLGEARGAGVGFWVAGADGDGVVEGLRPACYELWGYVNRVTKRGRVGDERWGGNSSRGG